MMDTLDPKTVLNIFLQKQCMRPVTKEDVIYTTNFADGVYVSMLTLACMEGVPQFQGTPAPNVKDAEKSAAAQAVELYKDEIARLPAPKDNIKKKVTASPVNPFACFMGKGKGLSFSKGVAFGKSGGKGWGLPPGMPPWMAAQMAEWFKSWDGGSGDWGGGGGDWSGCGGGDGSSDDWGGCGGGDWGGGGGGGDWTGCGGGGDWTGCGGCGDWGGCGGCGDWGGFGDWGDWGDWGSWGVWDPYAGTVAAGGGKAVGKRAQSFLPMPQRQEMDEVTKLATILQKFCQRELTKEDVVYTTSQYEEGFQATITMNCLEGAPEFNSEVLGDERAAQNNVAAMALETYAAEFGAIDIDGHAMGADPTSDEPKTVLNQFVQRKCGRPVTKQCVHYEAHPCPAGYQAVLTLNCIEGTPQFYGDPARTSKEAEKLAACAALKYYEHELAALNLGPASKKRKKTNEINPLLQGFDGSFDAAQGAAATEANPCVTYKSHLNSACMKLVRRTLAKGEIAYECEDGLAQGKIATVKIDCLGELVGETRWQGAECIDVKEAEQSAAAAALGFLMSNPAWAEVIQAPPTSKSAKKAGNKNSPGTFPGTPTPFGTW